MAASITYVKVDSLGCPIPTSIAAPIAAQTILGNNGSDADYPSALTATQVLTLLGLTAVLKFKGSTDCSGNPNYPAAVAGDAYVVSVAGKIGGAAGIEVEVGDVYFAIADNAGGDQAAVGADWDVLQYNIPGISAAGLAMMQAASATAQTALLDAFTGDSGAGGVKGLVPAPGVGDATKFLRGDATWASPAGGGGTFVPLTEAQRNASEFSGSLVDGSFETIANANLTGASAKGALILINDTISWTAGGAALEQASAEYYGRATGSGDVSDTGNNFIYDVYTRISAGNYNEEHHHMIVVPCGTGGDAGKFDIKWVDGSGGFDDMSRTCFIVGYWT